MSGICAMWRKNVPRLSGVAIAQMAEGLSVCAPEEVRVELDACAGLGVSARFGTEQIYRNSRLIVACDADLCREDELREAAVGVPDAPAAQKTAALVASLYERFGSEFVERLRGGFSVILWDCRQRTLLAAVDGFGIKRLAYYEDSEKTLVATRIGALTRTGEVETVVNPRAIVNVLNFTTSLGPDTVLAKVSRLLPGTMLTVSAATTRTRPYWDMRCGQGPQQSEKDLARQLDAVVEQSVAAHCKSDPPAAVGAFLSGGTDSSTIVGMMHRLGRDPVHAYSIGFQEQSFNELEYAAITAKKFNATHHTHLVGPNDCLEALPHMVRTFD
ncbi:MAG: asparagine synthase-related protein, partial [Bryobacteraceae bacterium]